MSALGQKRTYAVQNGMSALPLKADMCGATRDVRLGPIADIASGHEGFRLERTHPRPQYLAELGGSEQLAQKIRHSTSGIFTRELDRQNDLEDGPVFAV